MTNPKATNVLAVWVERIPHGERTPGLMMRLFYHEARAGYIITCPGCCEHLHVHTIPDLRADGRHWRETGDLLAGDLTLEPSIWHKEPEGCGWHGYLRNGLFVSV